jgi:glycosyltransferase involved in cell wall biosynthesis
MSCGLPVIVSRGGSCDDFCPPDDTWWVDTKVEPCPDDEAPTVRQTYWLSPSMDSLRQQMRQAYSNPAETAERGARSATYVSELLSWEKIGKLMAERVEAVMAKPPVRSQ